MRRAVKRFSNCLRIAARVEPGQPADHADRTGFVLDDKAGEALVDDLRHRTAVVGDDRRAAGHGFDHDEPERLRPVDRNQEPDRAAEEIRFLAVADLADVFDLADCR